MIIELTDAQAGHLRSCLEECMAVAEGYRQSIGDEDSIVLAQDLLEIGQTLGIHLEARHALIHSEGESDPGEQDGLLPKQA